MLQSKGSERLPSGLWAPQLQHVAQVAFGAADWRMPQPQTAHMSPRAMLLQRFSSWEHRTLQEAHCHRPAVTVPLSCLPACSTITKLLTF